MSGAKWVTADIITFARMNQKTLIVQAAEPAIMYPGMCWLDTDDDMLYQRKNANNGWYTITKEELAYTITGLWTFNRGAAVPFAVAAGSLKVTNLDADKLDGEEAAAIVTNARVKAHFPDTLVNVLSDHNKAAHDALNIDADTLDSLDSTAFPRIRDSQKNLQLTTTNETEICAHTLDGTNRIMRVAVFFRVITATTIVTVKIYYKNVADVATTCTLVDAKSLVVSDYTYSPLIFEVKASNEISLKITAGTANQVYATGTIEELA